MKAQYDVSLVERYLEDQDDLVRGSGTSNEDVTTLESEWGGSIPKDYRWFLTTFGWATFGTTEIPGLGRDVPRHLDLRERAHGWWEDPSAIPGELLPVYDSTADWCYCLSRLHPGTPVVIWSVEFSSEQPYDERYASWTDWFREQLIGTS